MEKLLDVIIPAYNAHKTISKTLASIAMQYNVENISVTIVNDNSDKNYSEFIDAYSGVLDIKEITLDTQHGCGASRQVGIDNAAAPYITFVDADDLLATPNFVNIMVKPMILNQNLWVHFGGIKKIEYDIPKEEQISSNHWTFIFGSVFRRKNIVENNIRFENTSRGEDVGFNKKVKLMAPNWDCFRFTNSLVYAWTDANKEGRISQPDYQNVNGKMGFIEGVYGAYKFAIPNFTEEDFIRIKQDVIMTLTMMYFYYIEMNNSHPGACEDYLSIAKKFYHECYTPFKSYTYAEDLMNIYSDNAKHFAMLTPILMRSINFFQFLDMIAA